jgi:hypothetical protein
VIGAALVAASVLLMALSTVRLFRACAQIERGSYEPEAFTEILVVAVFAGRVGAAWLPSSDRLSVHGSGRRPRQPAARGRCVDLPAAVMPRSSLAS